MGRVPLGGSAPLSPSAGFPGVPAGSAGREGLEEGAQAAVGAGEVLLEEPVHRFDRAAQ